MIFPLQRVHVPGYTAIVAAGRRVDLLLRAALPVFTDPPAYLPQDDDEIWVDFLFIPCRGQHRPIGHNIVVVTLLCKGCMACPEQHLSK